MDKAGKPGLAGIGNQAVRAAFLAVVKCDQPGSVIHKKAVAALKGIRSKGRGDDHAVIRAVPEPVIGLLPVFLPFCGKTGIRRDGDQMQTGHDGLFFGSSRKVRE